MKDSRYKYFLTACVTAVIITGQIHSNVNATAATFASEGKIVVSGDTIFDFNDLTLVDNKIEALSVESPTGSSGDSLSFISDVSQSEGLISAVRKEIPSASTSKKGVVKLTNSVNGSSEELALTQKAGSELMSLTTGTTIPEGADLNDYIVPGTYTCASKDIGVTLLHNPHIHSNFKLLVNKNTGNSKTSIWGTQTIIGTTGVSDSHVCTYTRAIVTDSNTSTIKFGDWEYLNVGTADISGIGDGSINGAISEINNNLVGYHYHAFTDLTTSANANSMSGYRIQADRINEIKSELEDGYDYIPVNIHCCRTGDGGDIALCQIMNKVFNKNSSDFNIIINSTSAKTYTVIVTFIKVKRANA